MQATRQLTLGSQCGCYVRGVQRRLSLGPNVAENSTPWRFPAVRSDGFCSSLAAMMKPYASGAVSWRYILMTREFLGILDSYSSPKLNPTKQFHSWRKRFLFLTGARPSSVC